MIRRPVTWLVVGLLGGALLAGCGGASTTTTTQVQSSATPATTSSTGASTGTTGTTSTPSGGAAALATPQAVEACKHAIQAQPTLQASAKGKLEAVCDKAAHGDQAAVRKAAREVCEEVINRSPIPSGASKEQALTACRAK